MSSGSSSTLQGEPTAVGTDGPATSVAAGSVLRRGDSVDRYLVLRQLGAGGMGEVYVAHDPDLDREIALKLVWGRDLEAKLSESERKRLLREAQSLARLSHPNVVVVHDAGEFQGGVFIAMEYVDGPTLRRWNAERTRTWEEIRDVFVEAGQGLLAAHEAGVVHRDFKPDNVMIDAQGKVRVLDFGLAREDGSALSTGDIRQGTPGYVAPDQLAAANADVRGDIFAFCVAFYEILYGERPFRPDGEDMLESAISGNTSMMLMRSDVPRWLRRTLSKGLSPVDQRWKTMHELLRALRQDRVQRRRRRAGLAVFALLGAGLAGFALSGTGPDCDRWVRSVDRAWSPESAEQFRQGVEQAGLEVGDETLSGLTTRVDAYAQSLREAMKAACREAEDAESPAVALRRACLSEHRDRLQVTVDSILSEPAWAVTQPDKALEPLVPLSRCEEAQRRLVYQEAVADPRVAELRRRILELERRISQGPTDTTTQELQQLLADAESVGSDAALVEVRSLLGSAAYERGEVAEAQRYWESALAVALQTSDRHLQWRPMSELMFVHAHAGRSDVVRSMLPIGRAILAGDDPSLAGVRSQLDNVEGLAYMRSGELEKARARFEALAESAQRLAGAGFLNNLGATHFMLGELEPAEHAYREALERYLESYGNDNLRAQEIRVNLADVLAAKGDFGAAMEIYDAALSTYAKLGVTASVELARTIHHRGAAAFRRGDFEAALASVDKAMEMLLGAVGPDHPYVVATKHTKVDVLMHQQELERAGRIMQQSAEAYEAFAPGGALRAMLEVQRGRFALRSRRLDEAQRHFNEGLRFMEDAAGDVTPRLECATGLLEVSLRRGENASIAEYLKQGQALLQTSAPKDPGAALALQTWVAMALAWSGRFDEAQSVARAAADATASNPADPLVPTGLQRRLIVDPRAAVDHFASANNAGTAK